MSRAGRDAITVRALQDVLAAVARDPALTETRATLLLEGFSVLPLSSYRSTLEVEDRARALGYPQLR